MTSLQMANAIIELVRREVRIKQREFTEAKISLASAEIRKYDADLEEARNNDSGGGFGYSYEDAVRRAAEQVKVKESELKVVEDWLTYTINKFLEKGV